MRERHQNNQRDLHVQSDRKAKAVDKHQLERGKHIQRAQVETV